MRTILGLKIKSKKLAQFACLTLMLLPYQNCGEGFKSSNLGDLTSTISPITATPPLTGTTKIALEAAALRASSPNAPAWSQAVIGVTSLITPDAHGRTPFTALNSVSSAYTILDWTSKTFWDPINREWMFLAGTTGWNSASTTFLRYHPTSDSFEHWQGDALGSGIFQPYGEAHMFDAVCFDPAGRKIYRHLTAQSSPTYYDYSRLGVFDVDTHAWSIIQFADGGDKDAYPSLEFFPDMGSKGTVLVIYTTSGYYRVLRFDVASQTWLSNLTGPTADPDQGPCIYHKRAGDTSGKVYFVNTNKTLYALDKDGVFTAMANSPVPMDKSYTSIVGVTSNHSILGILGEYLYSFHASGNIYRYDFTNNTWGSGPYDTIPYHWPKRGAPFSNNTLHYLTSSIVGPVPSENVMLFVTGYDYNNNTLPGAYVWKP